MDLPGWAVTGEGVTPEAAVEFWKQRARLTDAQAKALAEGARHRAFYVTGLARHDLVQLVADGIRKALEEGETLKDFKERIAAAIEAQGWHAARVENIFRSNMQTAYMAGRWKKMQAVRASRPYWQYIAVMDRRVRPSHAILHGKVYPADHEFWASNYPPNGFRCRCTVRTLSERQVKAQGLTVEREMPRDGVWTDPKTGMEHFVHFPGADKGFRNNPGKDWLDGLLKPTVERLERSSPALAAATVRNLVSRCFEGWMENPSGNFPLAVLAREDAEAIGSRATVAVISPATLAKQKSRHPELTAADYALAQEAVERGEKFRQDASNLAFVLNRPGGVAVIVKATVEGNELYVTSLRRLSRKDGKRDEEIERLRRGKQK